MTKPEGVIEDEEGERSQPVGGASGGSQPVSEANIEALTVVVNSEEALEQACQATRSLIRRSYQASRIEIMGRAAMHYINRRETGAISQQRPRVAEACHA